jgi:hypothetical protein
MDPMPYTATTGDRPNGLETSTVLMAVSAYRIIWQNGYTTGLRSVRR